MIFVIYVMKMIKRFIPFSYHINQKNQMNHSSDKFYSLNYDFCDLCDEDD